MIKDFEKLTREEQEFMYAIPAIVTVLIAGADGTIDLREKNAAAKLVHLRDHMGDEELMAYYHEVAEAFEANLDKVINSAPGILAERNKALSSQLEKLNGIWPKLDPTFAASFYKSIRSFAKRVAEASGGILRFGSVGVEERYWMDLNMVEDPAAE